MKNKLRTKLFVLLASAVFVCSLVAFTACSGGDHQLTFVEEQPATCTEAGHEAYYLCSHCGKLYADENAETELSEADTVIAALGHDLTHHEEVAATCTADGSVEYWSCARCELNFSDAEGRRLKTSSLRHRTRSTLWSRSILRQMAQEPKNTMRVRCAILVSRIGRVRKRSIPMSSLFLSLLCRTLLSPLRFTAQTG